MTPINNPPDTNRVVIVLVKDTEAMKVLGGTYRYKKNKWVGCASGEVTYDMPEQAVWIECPLQI